MTLPPPLIPHLVLQLVLSPSTYEVLALAFDTDNGLHGIGAWVGFLHLEWRFLSLFYFYSLLQEYGWGWRKITYKHRYIFT